MDQFARREIAERQAGGFPLGPEGTDPYSYWRGMYEGGYRPSGDAAPVGGAPLAQTAETGSPLPKYAANINLERLDTADDVKRAIADYADQHRDEFAAQGRGTQPLQTTQQVQPDSIALGDGGSSRSPRR